MNRKGINAVKIELTSQAFSQATADKYTWLRLFTLNFSPLISTKGFILFLGNWIELIYALPFIILRREILTSSKGSNTETVIQPLEHVRNILIHLERTISSTQYGQQLLFYTENRHLTELKKNIYKPPAQFNIFQTQYMAPLNLVTNYLSRSISLLLERKDIERRHYQPLKEQTPAVKPFRTVESWVQDILRELPVAYYRLLITGDQTLSLIYKSMAISQPGATYLPILGIQSSGKYGQLPLFYIENLSSTGPKKNIYPSWTQFSICQPQNITLLNLGTNYLAQGAPLVHEKVQRYPYDYRPLEEPSAPEELLQTTERPIGDMQKELTAAYRPWLITSFQSPGLIYKSLAVSQPGETNFQVTKNRVTNVFNVSEAKRTSGEEKPAQTAQSQVGDVHKELTAAYRPWLLTSFQAPGLIHKSLAISQSSEFYIATTKERGTTVFNLSRATGTDGEEKSTQAVESPVGGTQEELPAVHRPWLLTSFQSPGLSYKPLAISQPGRIYSSITPYQATTGFNVSGTTGTGEEEKSAQSAESPVRGTWEELPTAHRSLPLTSFQALGLSYKSLAISHPGGTYVPVTNELGTPVFHLSRETGTDVEEKSVNNMLHSSYLDYTSSEQRQSASLGAGTISPWGGILPIRDLALQYSRLNVFEPGKGEPVYHTYPKTQPISPMERTQLVKKEKAVEKAAPQKPPQFSRTDMDRLTDEVYRLIERKIRIEKERRGL